MWYTNKYRNIIVYKKYIGTYIKVGCVIRSLYASSGPKAERVPTNNQGIRTLSPLRRFRQVPPYSPNRHVSQSTTLKE